MRRLKLIHSPSGSDLFETVFLKKLDSVMDESIVVVPEQFTADTEKYLIEAFGIHGLFNVKVYSFERLAIELYRNYGVTGGITGKFGKRLIVSRILNSSEAELKIYGRNRDSGFLDMLVQNLDSFRRESIDGDMLDSVRASLDERHGLLKSKLSELALILRAYESALCESKPDDVVIFEKLIEEFPSKKNSFNLIVSGFNGLSDLEARFLAALSKSTSGDSYINIIVAEEGVLKDYSDRFEAQIRAAFKALDLDLETVESGERSEAFERAEAFSNIFRYRRLPASPKGLSIMKCGSREDELNVVAADILKKIREGAGFSDFAILSNSIADYEALLGRTLGDFGIPYFTDYKISVSDLSFIARLTSAFELIARDFPNEVLFKHLKYAAFTEVPEQSDDYYSLNMRYEETSSENLRSSQIIEDYIKRYKLRYGLISEKILGDNFKNAYLNSESAISFLNRIKKPVVNFASALKNASTYRDMSAAFNQYLSEAGIIEKLRLLEEMYSALFDDGEKRKISKQVSAIEDIQAELNAIDLGSSIDYKEFLKLISHAFKDFKMNMSPPGVETVVVGSIERSRLQGIKHLYFIGSNDGYMPSKSPQHAFFSEGDIKKLAERDIRGVKNAKNYLHKEIFDIYEKMLLSSDSVTFTYFSTDDAGEDAEAGFWLKSLNKYSAVAEIEPKVDLETIRQAGVAGKYFSELIKEEDCEIAAKALDMADFIDKGAYAFYENYLKSAKNKTDKLSAGLSVENRRNIEIRTSSVSVTGLENYANCPFSYFVNYILSPTEAPNEASDILRLGNIQHAAVEEFVKKYDDLNESERAEVRGNPGKNLMRELYSAADRDDLYRMNAEEYGKLRFFEPYFDKIADSIILQLDSSLCERKSIVEIDFDEEGREYGPEFRPMRGKIDRTDIYNIAGEFYYRIIDYKSGVADFDANKLEYGLGLQLPLYLKRICEGVGENPPGKPFGFFYFSLKENIKNAKTSVQSVAESCKGERYLLRGCFIDDKNLLKIIEKNALSGLPYTMAGGTLTKAGEISKVGKRSVESFDLLFSVAENARARLTEGILSGDINISPLKTGEINSCNRCNYRNICKMDDLRYARNYRAEMRAKNAELKTVEREEKFCGKQR